MHASIEHAPAATRQERRKLRTRARLIEAALRVIGRKGVDATLINDITEEADVGFGTFYNHFNSKEAILAAASAVAVEAHGTALDRVATDLGDAAEVIAVSVRHTIRMVEREPLWAWFAVRVSLHQQQIESSLAPRVLRDIRRGVRSGRFVNADPELLRRALGAVVWSVMHGKLTGALGADADIEAAACVLRMLGISAAEARRIAARPLPDVAPAQREEHA